MSIALSRPRLTREQFLDWAAAQDGRWEFDGFEPVAMTGGTRNHARIARNIVAALAARLRGGPCEVLGSDAGIAVTGDGIRYPDALVSCAAGPGTDRLVPGVVVVFEVVSPSSGRLDRIVKLREYHGVPTIRRYVIVESTTAALTVMARPDPAAPWTATALTEAEGLALPEIGVEVPVAALFEGVDLGAGAEG
jgi:Uma2 family endonuclease